MRAAAFVEVPIGETHRGMCCGVVDGVVDLFFGLDACACKSERNRSSVRWDGEENEETVRSFL